MKIIVIIAAGGVGKRFNASRPKQYCLLNGISVLNHTCQRLKETLPDAKQIVVMDDAWMEYAPDGVRIAKPGRTRWESVKNALEICADDEADIILVHDGVRPLVSRDIINRVIQACNEHQGVIPVVPVTDSLRRVDGIPVKREEFRAVQTPQGFRADLLRKAYMLSERPEFTDDASVMTAAGFNDIVMVNGDTRNIKITNPMDIKIAEIIMQDGVNN